MVNKKVKKKGSKKDSQVKVETAHPVRRRQSSGVRQRLSVGSKVSHGTHRNIRCRNCLIVDGYSEGEKVCRYCGARLFIE
ncbi:MAG: hypothetical protein KAX20_00885 [Candidatus Omnitrophica bacterium]|nr:hypothetical protein [Candidatus Omnitrophota bacterium]